MRREFQFLIEEFRTQIEKQKATLGANQLATMEDYRFICGQIRGLMTASAIVNDLAERVEKDA